MFANGKRLMKAGHTMLILNPQGMVDKVLKTARVETVTPIAYDLDEALRIVQGDQGETTVAALPTSTAGEESTPQQPEPVSAAPSPIAGSLKLAIKNELAALEDVNAELAQFLSDHRVPHQAVYAVNLAIDELVVNVMRYAYIDDDVHTIDIELVVEAEQVILQIVDDGRPFDPRRGPSLDLHAEDREAGGLGLLLVLDMVDVLDYRREGETNWTEVRIHLRGDTASSDLSHA